MRWPSWIKRISITRNVDPDWTGQPTRKPPILDSEIKKLSDPFGATAKAHRRNLLIACSTTLVLTLPGLPPSHAFIVDISGPSALSIMQGALVFVCLYEGISYVLNGVRDNQSWRIESAKNLVAYSKDSLEPIQVTIEDTVQRVQQLTQMVEKAQGVSAQVTRELGHLPGALRHVGSVLNGYIEILSKFSKQVNSYNSWTLFQLFVDWTFPLIILAVTIYRARHGVSAVVLDFMK